MNRVELLDRMEDFAARMARMVDALPRRRASHVFGVQVLRSAASIGANYREAGHASSRKHFISTMEIAQREAGETVYWLRVIAKAGLITPRRLTALAQEAAELFAILTAAITSAKKTKKNLP